MYHADPWNRSCLLGGTATDRCWKLKSSSKETAPWAEHRKVGFACSNVTRQVERKALRARQRSSKR